ncbi:MAG TPA: ABC transporter substrate-binding protein [Clostridiales bacterium]|nr:ABC transporter substrate-binding protein [Clostridiales bacterium]
MKRAFSLIILMLAVLMVVSACQPAVTTTTPTSTGSGTTATTAAPTTTQGPPTKLVLSMMTFGQSPEDLLKVQDEINKITLAKINCEIELLYINFGAAMEQYNLMLSSNEQLDLMVTFPYSYTSMVAQGKFQEIGGLIDQYGQGIKDVLGDYYKGGMVSGKIYGVTQARDLAAASGINISLDIVSKYNINLDELKSYEDIGKILETIKANEPESTPLLPSNVSSSMLEIYTPYDMLGDRFGVLMNNGQDTKVTNWYESAEYASLVRTMRDWYTKGYILKDAATTQDDQYSLLKSGKGYLYVAPVKFDGPSAEESASAGMPMTYKAFAPATSNTSNCTLFMWVVPTNSTTPDKAVQMLNLQYTDADIVNLLAWGIEGQHYVAADDGTIKNPDTVTAEKPNKYFINTPWMVGNAYMAKVWNGNPPDYWDKIKALNSGALVSKAMGFSYDPTPVTDEVVALNNVVSQYKKALDSGSVDPETVLPEFIAKLKEAGIDKVVAEKQKQLDAFLAGN